MHFLHCLIRITRHKLSQASWPIAFLYRCLCKYCFCVQSGALGTLNLFKTPFILPTYFDFYVIHPHFNFRMAAILMTSLLGLDTELRWAN